MAAKIIVTAVGLLLVVAVDVYFLGSRRRKAPRLDQNRKRRARLSRR